MRTKLHHEETGGNFTAVSQAQIDRLTDPDREGGPWVAVAEGADARAQSYSAKELRDQADAQGLTYAKSATKAELAALIETGGASATDTEV